MAGLAIASVFAWILAFPFYGPLLVGIFTERAPAMGHIFAASFISSLLVLSLARQARLAQGLPGRIAATATVSFLTALLVWLPLPPWLLYLVVALLGPAAACLIPGLGRLFQSQNNPVYCLAILLVAVNAALMPFSAATSSAAAASPLWAFLLTIPPALALLLPPPEKISGQTWIAPSTGPDRHARQGQLVGLVAFGTAFLLDEAVVYYTVEPAVSNMFQTGAALGGYGVYFLAVILLALYTYHYGHLSVAGLSLSALGTGITAFALAPDLPPVVLASYFLQMAGLAGMDLFYWLSLWTLARNYGFHRTFAMGAAGYFTLIAMADAIVRRGWGGNIALEPMEAVIVISVLFLAIPFVFQHAVILPASPLCTPASPGDLQPAASLKAEPGMPMSPATLPLTGSASADNPSLSIASSFQERLTPAEQRVFKLLAHGRADAEIAEALTISRHTVKFHVRNILQKAGVQNRYQLLARINNSLVTDGHGPEQNTTSEPPVSPIDRLT